MPQIQGVKGEAVVSYCESLTTQEMGYHRALPVYNPIGPVLPPEQSGLEADYRRELDRQFGITFTQLMTIANMPIGRFLKRLQREHQAQNYMRLLQESFNPQTLDSLMCRHEKQPSMHQCERYQSKTRFCKGILRENP